MTKISIKIDNFFIAFLNIFENFFGVRQAPSTTALYAATHLTSPPLVDLASLPPKKFLREGALAMIRQQVFCRFTEKHTKSILGVAQCVALRWHTNELAKFLNKMAALCQHHAS